MCVPVGKVGWRDFKPEANYLKLKLVARLLKLGVRLIE